MMHGYLAFDGENALLTPFRTWRNTITEPAAEILTEKFQFNIPQRWSVAHLYQAILNGESHVGDIRFITTLSGYIHWKLTGEKVLGVNDASGMFPIDSSNGNYNARMLSGFDDLVSGHGFGWTLPDILPKVLRAGDPAGFLTPEGARLLDPGGQLASGIPVCPPEGDAGTGMAATNSVSERTGNVSAGTSIFLMAVLERELSGVYRDIDNVMTPAGRPVAMVHCNNCTTDLDAWVKLFGEAIEATGDAIGISGVKVDKSALYEALYRQALEGDPDCGGLISYNYYAGEHITKINQGRPLFARLPGSKLTLANFMRALLFSAMSTLRLGMEVLTGQENVRLDALHGHGGLFKTKTVGQKLMAAALNTPVSVTESAGEGGAWGIALLAAFMMQKGEGETLEAYLAEKVFSGSAGSVENPDPNDVRGFAAFIERYRSGLDIERAAEKYLHS